MSKTTLLALSFLCGLASVTHADTILIDNFDNSSFAITSATPLTFDQNGVAGVLEGDRDGVVGLSVGGGPIQANNTTVSGRLFTGSGVGSIGTATMTYGDDIVSGIDLIAQPSHPHTATASASTTFIQFDNFSFFSGANALSSLTVTIVDTSSNTATNDVAVTSFGTQETDLFVNWTGGGSVDFTSVDTVSFSWGVNGSVLLDNFAAATTLPEPSTLATVSILCGALVFHRRRRRQ